MNAQATPSNNSQGCEKDYLGKIRARYPDLRVRFTNIKVIFLVNSCIILIKKKIH